MRILRPSARPDVQQQSQPVPAVHVLQGNATQPRRRPRATCRSEDGTSRSGTHDVVVVGQRSTLRYNYAYHLKAAPQPRRPELDATSDCEYRSVDVSARVRTSGRDDRRRLRARRKRQHAGRDREHLQRVERDQQDVRRPHAPIWIARRRSRKFEHLHRQLDAGNFTFNGIFTGNAVGSISSVTVRPAPERSVPLEQRTIRQRSRRSSTTTGG